MRNKRYINKLSLLLLLLLLLLSDYYYYYYYYYYYFKTSKFETLTFFLFLVGPGVIIDGASLGINILKTILDTLGDVRRKVAIGVDNESGYEWEAINAYFYSGSSDEVMPHLVPSGKINVNYVKVLL